MEPTLTIDPDSPIAREKDRPIPVRKNEVIGGEKIHQKVVPCEAPRDHDPSSISRFICNKTGCNVWLMKSKDTNIIVTNTPSWVNATGN